MRADERARQEAIYLMRLDAREDFAYAFVAGRASGPAIVGTFSKYFHFWLLVFLQRLS